MGSFYYPTHSPPHISHTVALTYRTVPTILLYIDMSRKKNQKKSRQHPDFPGGHPPEYYPSLRLLNFTERTGYGVLSLRWPSTLETVFLLLYMLVILLAIIDNIFVLHFHC